MITDLEGRSGRTSSPEQSHGMNKACDLSMDPFIVWALSFHLSWTKLKKNIFEHFVYPAFTTEIAGSQCFAQI